MFRPFLIAYAQPFWPPERQHKTVNKIDGLTHTKNYWEESVCMQTCTCDGLLKQALNSQTQRLMVEGGAGWLGVELDTKKRFPIIREEK